MPLIELKALQDWVLEREFRKIPGVADVVSWGGGTKQYQVVVDPARLRAYNVTLKQVFDAVNANNANAGGSYISQGQYALTVRGIGLFRSPRDIEQRGGGRRRRARRCGSAIWARWRSATPSGWAYLGRDHDDDARAGHRADAQGREPGARDRGGEGALAGDRNAAAGRRDDPPVLQPRRAGAPHGDHRAAQPGGGRRAGRHPAVALSLRRAGRLHRGPHHPAVAPVRLRVHGSARGAVESPVAGGHRLRDHRRRRRDHDREHRAPPGRAAGARVRRWCARCSTRRWRWRGR